MHILQQPQGKKGNIMKTNKTGLIAILLWAGLILVLGIRFVKGSTEKTADGRTAIIITDSEKTMILGEMRQLLQAVQGVVNGLDKNDAKAITDAALGGGTAIMIDHNPELMMKLPLEFKGQGIAVHKYFDKIGEEAKNGAKKEKILSMLNTQLQNCIACHAAYQFKTK